MEPTPHRPGLGSIPARAESRPAAPPRHRAGGVHPRACGEQARRTGHRGCGAGPSPRVRRAAAGLISATSAAGSIPARAESSLPDQGIHPPGTPFRATTKDPDIPATQPHKTPTRPHHAHAVEPTLTGTRNSNTRPPLPPTGRTHPHTSGEQDLGGRRGRRVSGPSPHVRGAGLEAPGACCQGAIPARTGSSSSGPWPPRRRRVHPRACGEQLAFKFCLAARSGPSPRVREAAQRRRPQGCRSGPPPRARGAAGPPEDTRRRLGSIPARAGSRQCWTGAPTKWQSRPNRNAQGQRVMTMPLAGRLAGGTAVSARYLGGRTVTG